MGVVKQLLAAGAIVDATDVDGTTPLHLATEAKVLGTMQLLLDAGADANASKKEGWTPLYLAAFYVGDAEAQMLLRAGALVNKPIDSGDTALHAAAKWGHEGLVRTLLNAGAYALAKNNIGQTPATIAQHYLLKQRDRKPPTSGTPSTSTIIEYQASKDAYILRKPAEVAAMLQAASRGEYVKERHAPTAMHSSDPYYRTSHCP
eukprot:SAG11_NODE_236_length_11840_cov_6.566051_8_plen_204_part_00